jgi:antirestriction protein ArdC
MATRCRASAEDRAERRRRDRERLELAARELLTSEGWRRWVAVRRHNGLGRYSFGNQLLIALESHRRGRPATYVAGYRWWAEHGYQVRRGERAIRILAPIRRRVEHGDEERLAVVGFRAVAVFDRSQVDAGADAIELEPPSEPITGESHSHHLEAIERFARELGTTVDYAEVQGAARGYYDPRAKAIVVERSLPANARLRVLLHEVAHALVDREADAKLSYADEEVVVETAGHVASAAVGLDTSCEAIPYVAGWGDSGGLDAARRCAELIDRTAHRLEDALALLEPGGGDPLDVFGPAPPYQVEAST